MAMTALVIIDLKCMTGSSTMLGLWDGVVSRNDEPSALYELDEMKNIS